MDSQLASQSDTIDFRVITDSMSPLIKRGDYVKTIPIQDDNVPEGSIILYQRGDIIVVHRFLFRMDNKTLYFKADNHWTSDPPILKSNLVSRVVSVKRGCSEIALNKNKWKIANTIFTKFSLMEMVLNNKKLLPRLFHNIAFLIRSLAILLLSPEFFRQGLCNRAFEKELNLILLACKQTQEEKDKEKIQNLSKDKLDWDYVLYQIEEQKIAIFLYQNIKNLSVLDENRIKFINRLYQKQEEFNLILLRNFESFTEKLFNNNIEAIIFKDAFLMHNVYRASYQRPTHNINLIIHPKDLQALKIILDELGYYPTNKSYNQERLSPSIEYANLNFKNNEGVNIEIRFNLFCLDFLAKKQRDIWSAKIHLAPNHPNIFGLSLKEHLIYLLTNLMMNDYGRIIDFLDVNYFIIRYKDEINWQAVIKVAKESKLLVCVYYGLLFMNKLMDTPISLNTLEQLKPSFMQRMLFQAFYDEKKIAQIDSQKLTKELRSEIKLLLAGKLSIYPKDIFALIKTYLKILLPPRGYIKYRYGLKSDKTINIYLYYLCRILRTLSVFK
jgi:hypothetical protein